MENNPEAKRQKLDAWMPARPSLDARNNPSLLPESVPDHDLISKLHAEHIVSSDTSGIVPLLKRIDRLTAEAFRGNVMANESASKQEQLNRVVFQSNMAGIEENSEEFYGVLQFKCKRMSLARQLTIHTLEHPATAATCGLDAFERALMCGAARISESYDGDEM